jgi:cysteine dioxygenase
MESSAGDDGVVTLADWLRILHSFSSEKLASVRADELFSELAAAPEDWYAHLQFCEDSHTRNLVGGSDKFELVAMAWLGHQKTPIQDHAGQRCWMWVVHGSLTFQSYRRNGSEIPVPLGEPQKLVAGQKLYIDDEWGWHTIENKGHTPAVSLHLYAHPISACKVFDEKTLTVETRLLETISVLAPPSL